MNTVKLQTNVVKQIKYTKFQEYFRKAHKDVHKVGEIQWGKVLDGLKGVQKDFALNSEMKQ